MKALNILFILGFAGFLYLPLVDQIWDIDKTKELQENRKRYPMPALKLTVDSFEMFPEQFERYYRDQFGMRNFLVRKHHQAIYFGLNESPEFNIIVGKKGWFFKGGPIKGFNRSQSGLSKNELIFWKNKLLKWEQYFKKKNISFLFIVPPIKQTIYPEFMPNRFLRVRNKSRLDELYQYLKENTDIWILDVRQDFFKYKKKGELYQKTDPHWNDLGAFVFYESTLKEIRTRFPEIKPPFLLKDFSFSKEKRHETSALRMLAIDDVLYENYLTLTPTFNLSAKKTIGDYKSKKGKVAQLFTTSKSNLPNVLIFRDSFFTESLSWFAEDFNTTAVVWQRELDTGLVEKIKPDIVILEIVEDLMMMHYIEMRKQ